MPELDRYEFVAAEGDSAQDTVRVARDTREDRDVMVWRVPISPSLSAEARAGVEERLKSETETASALEDEHLVRVLDSFIETDTANIVTEVVEGHSLETVLGAGPLGHEAALGVITPVLSALAAAGEQGLVHRALSPRTVFLLDDGSVKVAGLCMPEMPMPFDPVSLPSLSGGPAVEMYRSPEQIQGGQTDARSEVFIVGVMLYEMLVGQNPFAAPQYATTMYRIAYEEPSALGIFVPGLPEHVSAIVDKALAKDPDLRYQTPAEMLADLESQTAPDLTAIHAATAARAAASADAKPTAAPRVSKPIPWKRVAVVAAVLLAILGTAGGVYAFRQKRLAEDAATREAIRAEGVVMVARVAEAKALERDLRTLLESLGPIVVDNQAQLVQWDSDWAARQQAYRDRTAEVDRHNASEQAKYDNSEEYYYDWWTGTATVYHTYTKRMWSYPDPPTMPPPVTADISAQRTALADLASRSAALTSAVATDSAQAQYFMVVFARLTETIQVIDMRIGEARVAMDGMITRDPNRGDFVDGSKVAAIDLTEIATRMATVDQEVGLHTQRYGVTIEELLSVEATATPGAAEASTTPTATPDSTTTAK